MTICIAIWFCDTLQVQSVLCSLEAFYETKFKCTQCVQHNLMYNNSEKINAIVLGTSWSKNIDWATSTVYLLPCLRIYSPTFIGHMVLDSGVHSTQLAPHLKLLQWVCAPTVWVFVFRLERSVEWKEPSKKPSICPSDLCLGIGFTPAFYPSPASQLYFYLW